MSLRLMFFFILIIPIIISCDGKKREPIIREPSRVKADSMKIEKTSVPVYRIFMGKTQAKENILISSKTSGYITDINFREGDKVLKGKRLLSIDSEGIRARISSLESQRDALINEKRAIDADFKYSESQFKRFKLLRDENAVTEEEYERVKSLYLKNKENLASMDSKIKSIEGSITESANLLRYTDIHSPVTGIITKKFVDNGSLVQTGTPLFEIISREGGFWFETYIDEKLFELVGKQKEIFLSIPSLNIEQISSISVVVPDIDPKTRTFKVRIDINDENMRSGHFGRIYLIEDYKQSILIPTGAVVMRGGLSGVYIVGKDRIVHWRIIKLGQIWKKNTNEFGMLPLDGELKDIKDNKGLYIEVLNGLDTNDTIVISNLEGIREGFRVE